MQISSLLVGILASSGALAGGPSETHAVNVFCEKDETPQSCEGAEFTFSVDAPSMATAMITATEPTCSAIRAKVAVDGAAEVVSEPIGGSGPKTTQALDLGRLEPGTHTVRVHADGLQGGCNKGFLKAWSGAVALKFDAVAAPVVAAVAVPIPQAPAVGGPVAPPVYATCLPCHGPDGSGSVVMGAPGLAGQESWYLVRQIQHFRDGLRGTQLSDVYGMQMRMMALTVKSEDEVKSLAAYLSSLPGMRAPATIVDGDAERGRTLFQVCQVCHGDQGEGNEAMNAPRLTVQQDWYLARQIQNFRANVRGYHPLDATGKQMQPMTGTIPDEQSVHDVIAYIQTLRSPPP